MKQYRVSSPSMLQNWMIPAEYMKDPEINAAAQSWIPGVLKE